MNCTDFLAKLTDFFDGNIEPDLLTEVKQHLGSCHHCEVVVDTTRETINVYRGNEIYDFPDEVSTRLRSAIMERCEKSLCKHDKSGASAVDAPEESAKQTV